MSHAEFRQIVEEAFLTIPETFRERVKNVAILVEDEPSPEVRAREGLGEGETLLGLYHGIPASARGAEYGVGMTLPDTVTIYQIPIEEEAAGSGEEIRTIVAETIWHELAHYFGMEEDEVRGREEKRRAP